MGYYYQLTPFMLSLPLASALPRSTLSVMLLCLITWLVLSSTTGLASLLAPSSSYIFISREYMCYNSDSLSGRLLLLFFSRSLAKSGVTLRLSECPHLIPAFLSSIVSVFPEYQQSISIKAYLAFLSWNCKSLTLSEMVPFYFMSSLHSLSMSGIDFWSCGIALIFIIASFKLK